MVNANGYSTRTRDSTGAFQPVAIDKLHRFFTPDGQRQRDSWLANFKSKYTALSPATRRVLQAVRAALLVGYDPKHGYRYAAYVNRVAIAAKLGRDSLVPYDIHMLRALGERKLVLEARHALPRKQYGDIWLGAGAEFVYCVPVDVLYCLLATDPNEQTRLAELASSGARKARGESAQAEIDKRTQELRQYRSLYNLREPKKRSLLEKIVDLLSW